MTKPWTPMIALALAACGGSSTVTEDSCLTQFPADGGFDFASDNGATVAGLQTECADAGSSDCDVAVTRAAAECIGDAEGIGTDGRSASLVYNVLYEAIVWNVQDVTTAATTASGVSGGHGVTIHADTGEVLATYDWNASP